MMQTRFAVLAGTKLFFHASGAFLTSTDLSVDVGEEQNDKGAVH